MSEYGEQLNESIERFRRLLPGPIERIRANLTEGDKRAQWLCGGDAETRVGGRVDMHFHNLSLSGDDDIPRPEKYGDIPEKISFAGEVTRCEPPRVLTHTWEFDDEASEVCYELEAQGDKVLLTLTHRKLETSKIVLSVSTGWHCHLNLLEDVLAGQQRRPFYKMQSALEDEYGQRLGLG